MRPVPEVYTLAWHKLMAKHRGNAILDQVFDYHQQLVGAFAERDSLMAATVTAPMLRHRTDNL